MPDDDDRRRYWRERGLIAPADLVALKLMLHTFAQRPGETEQEWRQRLADQDEAAAMDTDEDDEASAG